MCVMHAHRDFIFCLLFEEIIMSVLLIRKIEAAMEGKGLQNQMLKWPRKMRKMNEINGSISTATV